MRSLAALLCLMLCLLPPAGARSSPAFTGYDVVRAESEALAEGLTLWRYDLLSREEIPRAQRLRLLVPDASRNPALRFRIGRPEGLVKGLRPVSAQMAWLAAHEPGFRPLAAVNGDFFDMRAGGPLGLTVDQGRALTSGEFGAGWSLGFTAQGQARIGQPRLSLSLSAARSGRTLLQDLPIDALNALRADVEPHQSTPRNAYEARQDNLLTLYTSDYYRSTMARDGGYELRLTGDQALRAGQTLVARVSAVHGPGKVTVAGTAAIPQGMPLGPGRLALSATGDRMDSLRLLQVGDEVSIRCEITAGWEDCVTILGGGRPDGGPLLVLNGAPAEGQPEVDDYQYFYPSAHARTAAGLRKDGSLFLLVAEGYQPGAAEGLSIAELRQLMLDLGADAALNLDGGPSSTLALRGEGGFAAVTSPGRRLETAVGNSLVIGEAAP